MLVPLVKRILILESVGRLIHLLDRVTSKPMLLEVALRAAEAETLTLVLLDSLVSSLMDKRAFPEHDCGVPHA